MKLADHQKHYRADAEEFDYFAPRTGADRDAARRIQEAVLYAARPGGDDIVCDLGSGGGWLLDDLADSNRIRVVSVDLGMHNLRRLRERFGDRVLPVVADAARLPFRRGSFTCMIASEVLEHCNDPATVVRQAHGALAHGGRLVVSTPYREVLRYSLCIHCNRPTPQNAHLHSFDENRLSEMFREAGFAPARCFTLQNKAFLHLRLSPLFRFLPFRVWRLIDRLFTFVIAKCHTIVIHAER
ncbi:MAG: class I SAM-dependent methyltransferase [Bacteroidota bacterium]|nr:class I SAM-dependent methyltransferase [Bacteroidota bacterium]